MPKEKSEKEKSKKKNKKEEKEYLEEDSEEKSELEEEIENTEEKIDIKQFQNFMQRDFQIIPQETEFEETGAPVLEKVNPPQEDITALELELMQSTDFDRTEKSGENDSFKYNIGGGTQRDESKYQRSYDEIRAPKITDITRLGRNSFSERPEIDFRSSEEKFESVNREEYTPAKIADVQKLGKENPLEKKDVKYTPSKY